MRVFVIMRVVVIVHRGSVCEGGGMRLAAIHTYPIKSCRRIDRAAVEVQQWGLAGDRRWLVITPAGTALTQRAEPRLALIRPRTGGSKAMILHAAGTADLTVRVPEPDGVAVTVRVSRDDIDAIPAGAVADGWLSTVLGRKVRLVYLDDPGQRAVDPAFGDAEDRVAFADGYPVLLTSAASLDAVNDWLVADGDEPVPMTRFRPNLVVSGAPAWAEDAMLGMRVRVGGVTFRAVKPSDRCVVTTIDQDTADRGSQPLRVLGQRRSSPMGPLFGMNLIPDTTGTVAVGDPVEVLTRGSWG
jgi:uncharacterized protein YcbX